MTFLDYLYNNPADLSLGKDDKPFFNRYLEYMRDILLSEKGGSISPILSKGALTEARNLFFGTVSKKQDRIIESVLYKNIDKNIYLMGMENLLDEYMSLDIKEYLGMSYPEWLAVPINLKETIVKKVMEKIKSKERAIQDEIKKNRLEKEKLGGKKS